MHVSEAQNTSQNNTEAPAMTEAQALEQQAEEARQAIARTISLFSKNLGTSIDPRAWTQSHPWMTLASAAISGFVATSLLIPTAEDRALRRLAAIERAVAPKIPQPAHVEHPAPNSFLKNMIGEILKSVRPIIVSAISAGMASQQQAAAGRSNGDTGPHNVDVNSPPAEHIPPAL